MMSSNETIENEDSFETKSGLAAQLLLKSSPVHSGRVLKLHVPLLYTFLPESVQNWIAPDGYVTYLLAPQWKEREIILCGSYLYKFLDAKSTNPKGTPIELRGVNAKVVEEGDDDLNELGLDSVMENLPTGIEAVFSMNSYGKQRYFAATSREEALTWVNSIREARQEAITREMGHSKVPEPESWKYFDGLAKQLIEKKERIQKRQDDSLHRQFEAGSLGGALRPIS